VLRPSTDAIAVTAPAAIMQPIITAANRTTNSACAPGVPSALSIGTNSGGYSMKKSR
jgi:hypothetical protein